MSRPTDDQIREHLNNLSEISRRPCLCDRTGDHSPECQRGRAGMEATILALSWVLGENSDYVSYVEIARCGAGLFRAIDDPVTIDALRDLIESD